MWTWESISKALAGKPVEMLAVLNQRMKTLEQHLAGSESTAPPDARVYTTDATLTTLKAYAIPVSTTLDVSGRVVARRTGGSGGSADDGASYRVDFSAKNAAGTAALIDPATVTVISEAQAGWDVSVTASGGNVLVQVTGAADNNITWLWTGQSIGVNDRT